MKDYDRYVLTFSWVNDKYLQSKTQSKTQAGGVKKQNFKKNTDVTPLQYQHMYQQMPQQMYQQMPQQMSQQMFYPQMQQQMPQMFYPQMQQSSPTVMSDVANAVQQVDVESLSDADKVKFNTLLTAIMQQAKAHA